MLGSVTPAFSLVPNRKYATGEVSKQSSPLEVYDSVATAFLSSPRQLPYSWPWQEVYWMEDPQVYLLKAFK